MTATLEIIAQDVSRRAWVRLLLTEEIKGRAWTVTHEEHAVLADRGIHVRYRTRIEEKPPPRDFRLERLIRARLDLCSGWIADLEHAGLEIDQGEQARLAREAAEAQDRPSVKRHVKSVA